MPMLDNRDTIDILLNNKTEVFSVSKNETLASVLKNQADISWPIESGEQKAQCELCKWHAFPVLLNGSPINASYILAKDINHAEVETLDHLYGDSIMLQIASAIKAFQTNRYAYCISGMELSLYAYLKGNPSPTREDIRKMLSGNLCACVGKKQIEGAISNVLEIVAFVTNKKEIQSGQ